MTTYVTMQNRIAREVRAISTASASDIETEIQNAILSAIKFHERHRFYFNTAKGQTFSTVADQEYYASSDNSAIPNLIAIDSMVVTVSSVKRKMRAAEFEELDAEQNGSTTGSPQFFAYYAQAIRLYPIPDAVYTITAAWHYRLTALSAGSDSNAWTTDAEELIRSRATADILESVVQDFERADRARRREAEALAVLKMETRKRRSVSRLGTAEVAAMSGPAAFDIVTG